MKKITKFVLEKTFDAKNGGVKIETPTTATVGFKCPDCDGLALADALRLVQAGEKIEIVFPFTLTEFYSKNNKEISAGYARN
jgi:hypothetical protein